MPGGWCDLEIKRIEREEEKEVREKLLKMEWNIAKPQIDSY